MFRRCKIQPSSTTFIAEVDTEKFRKLLEEEWAVPDDGYVHCGDVPTLMQAEIFYKVILPHWKEVVKGFSAPSHAVLDAGADAGYGYKQHYSGMLVVTPEIACEVGCPWCYARGWFTNTSYDDLRVMAKFDTPEREKFEQELAACILKCMREVESLTVVLGGATDPLLDQSLRDLVWTINNVVEEVERAREVESKLSGDFDLKYVYTGLSTSYWYYNEDDEVYDYVDCVALTVFSEELREKHPKFANVNTKEYALVLADVVESLKDKSVFLTFICPFYPSVELEYAVDNLKTKVAKELSYLILHPHNWPDESVYADIEFRWDEIIEELLQLPLYHPIEAIKLDACMVKKFTGVDLCTGAHWRLYIPSLRFEKVSPCPRGGKCIV